MNLNILPNFLRVNQNFFCSKLANRDSLSQKHSLQNLSKVHIAPPQQFKTAVMDDGVFLRLRVMFVQALRSAIALKPVKLHLD